MKTHRSFSRPDRRELAFSLVEVALALGVVGFALVGIVGALPVAMNNERLSVMQTRAASVANAIFANMRSQPFTAVQYVDDSTATLNLDNLAATSPPTPVLFYAAFDEVATTASTTDARRLHFVSNPPDGSLSDLPKGSLCYVVVLNFNNHPTGTFAPYPTTASSTPVRAEANGIEATIFQYDNYNYAQNPNHRPTNVFRFNTVIANCSE